MPFEHMAESAQPHKLIALDAPDKFETYFYTVCETCGRPLRVHVEHLGSYVACGQCGHEFVASDPALCSDRS